MSYLTAEDEVTESFLYEAGWQHCYHRGSRSMHYNVKVYGVWLKEQELFRDIAKELGYEDQDRVRLAASIVFEREMERWWEDLQSGSVDFLLGEPFADTELGEKDFWQDGRSGGWLEIRTEWALQHPDRMVALAQHCDESKQYYASEDWRDTWKFEIVERLKDEDAYQARQEAKKLNASDLYTIRDAAAELGETDLAADLNAVGDKLADLLKAEVDVS